ncbi:MAG: protein TolA, partial [Pseudolabrys sp.]
PKAEVPKPLVEKLAEPKPVEAPVPKIAEKQEVKPTAQKTAEPEPLPKPDPIADKLKKQDEKKQEAKEEPKPTPPKKPEKKQPKFDADKIAALLDKREPTRNAATGETLTSDPTLGTPLANSNLLSASEISLFVNKIRQCWDVPAGVVDASTMILPIKIRLNRNGSLAADPTVEISVPNGPMQVIAESAVRAIIRCQPYTMFSQAKYDSWKELPLGFDPKFMFGG